MPSQPQAFISYSRADRQSIIPLASLLADLGLNVWLDTRDIQPGEVFVEAISNAIASADVYVVALSPTSMASDWVRHELGIALTLETETGNPKVLPVLLAKTDIPAVLAGRQYVDIRSSLSEGQDAIRRFVDANLTGLAPQHRVLGDKSRLYIGSIELELTKDTIKSYGGLESEHTRNDVSGEAGDLVRTLRRRANGVLLNFVPAAAVDLDSPFFRFPNGEITTNITDGGGDLVGSVRQTAIVAVQVLNPDESKLQELISSRLKSLGVSKAIYSFILDPPIRGLAERSLARLQSRYVILGWDAQDGADVELDDDLRLTVRVSDEQVQIAVSTRYPFQFEQRAREFSVRAFAESLIAA